MQENKKLRLDVESSKKQLADLRNSHPLQQNYNKEIEHWKKKCSEYEQIKEKLTKEIENLKRSARQSEDQFES